MTNGPEPAYGQSTDWKPERPRLRLFPLLISWLATGVALMVAAAILPGVDIESFWGALLVAAIVAALNAVIPPVLAALKLPLTLVLGFLLVLIADAVILQVAAELDVTDGVLTVDNFGWALLAALVVAAVSVVLAVILGSDDTSSIRIAQRIARRQGIIASTDVPGIVYLEIDGLALPVLRRAMRDGNAPNMARWLRDDTHRVVEWETDLSSQTGASQAGILLGSNEDISAFRWVEKENATMMTCSAPPDCAEIERRRGTGIGLLVDGGASRGNLLSGEAEDVILTVSRMEAEKKSNPGYRGVLRERRQRHAHARPLRMGGHPGVDRSPARDPQGRAPAWAPRRHLPVDERCPLRLRARPDRLGRPHRHDAWPACRLRDVLELRRGGPPLRSGAQRHARGVAQARRQVRSHRAGVPVCAAALRDRCSLRPRADPGRYLQTAQRLRARRAGRALARARRRGRASPAATSRAPWSATPSARRRARRRNGPRTTSPTATSSCSAPATSASST